MPKLNIKRIVIGIIIVIVALVGLQLIYYANIYTDKNQNHYEVKKLVDNDILYSWDTLDEELELINNWIENKHLLNEDKGRLYERASLIYLQQGEYMSYYRYLGYALYYLERSPEKDYTINIYLDLANFHLNNYAFDYAKDMMDAAENVCDFEDIDNLQIKSYAFRMLSILAINNEDYDTAEAYLGKAQEYCDMSHTGVYEDAYTAIDDVWLARIYVETGRYEECAQILEKYRDSEYFTADEYREIFLRDFIIPYYQTDCYLTFYQLKEDADNQNYDGIEELGQQADKKMEEFTTLCAQDGYEKQALNTILKVISIAPPKYEKYSNKANEELYRLYKILFTQQNDSYADIINNQINDSIESMNYKEKEHQSETTRLTVNAILVVIVCLASLILILIIVNNRYDGLTTLLTRKTFDKDLSKIKHSKSAYTIIMMDVDDFKSINDTYGHQAGDKVLNRLGQILSSEVNQDIHAYRYGGEEFVVILEKNAQNDVMFLAEGFRVAMERQKWSFDSNLNITLSIGISSGSDLMDVVGAADSNLYYSKKNGKNRITI